MDFQSFWDKCLYDGVLEIAGGEVASLSFAGDVNAAASGVAANYKANNTGFEIALYIFMFSINAGVEDGKECFFLWF